MFLSTYKIKLFAFFILWFLVIFGPVMDLGIGPFSDVSFLISVIVLLSGLHIRVQRFYVFLAMLLVAISALALFTAIFFDSSELEVGLRAILRPARALIVMYAVIILAHFSSRSLQNKFPSADIVEIYSRALSLIYGTVVLHGAIMLLQFLYPDFRDFVYSFTMAKYQLEFYQNFRMAGLSGAGGAQVSFVQGLGFCLGAFLWTKVRAKKTILFSNVILFLSVILSGRSGLIPIFLVISFLLVKNVVLALNLGVVKKELFSVRMVLSLFLLALVGAFGLFRLLENEYLVIALERTFATFISYSETGEFSDNTLVALSNMFILPTELLHVLLGKASYLENNTYYDFNTDIGYFRIIWGYGVLGLGVHLLFYLSMLWCSLKFGAVRRFFLEINVFLILLILLFNSKEIFFFSKMSFQICFATFALAYSAILIEKTRFGYEKFN
jgi:hypothetical protein